MGIPRTKSAATALAFALIERAGKSFAQGVLLSLGKQVALSGGGFDVRTIDWLDVLAFGMGAVVLSVLMNIVTSSSDGNPSLGSAEVLAAPGQTADPVASPPVVVEQEPVTPSIIGRTPEDVAREFEARHAYPSGATAKYRPESMDNPSADPDVAL